MKKAGVLFILSGVGEFILSKVEVLSLSRKKCNYFSNNVSNEAVL